MWYDLGWFASDLELRYRRACNYLFADALLDSTALATEGFRSYIMETVIRQKVYKRSDAQLPSPFGKQRKLAL